MEIRAARDRARERLEGVGENAAVDDELVASRGIVHAVEGDCDIVLARAVEATRGQNEDVVVDIGGRELLYSMAAKEDVV